MIVITDRIHIHLLQKVQSISVQPITEKMIHLIDGEYNNKKENGEIIPNMIIDISDPVMSACLLRTFFMSFVLGSIENKVSSLLPLDIIIIASRSKKGFTYTQLILEE